ncbi:hypothetical protein B0H19DRAFT_1374680, partial [Mycena capillaripes]
MAPPPPTSEARAKNTSAQKRCRFPKKFKLGFHTIGRAFAALRSKVEGTAGEVLPSHTSDPAYRWAWFVGLAVKRFEKWCKAMRPAQAAKGLVLLPVAVLMVWHAYMLNPGWYAEDGIRIKAVNRLQKGGITFGLALGRLGRLLTSDYSEDRANHWMKMTGMPFDPIKSAMRMVSRKLACPKCRIVLEAPHTTETGTGYLQQKFKIQCTRCSLQITRETLAVCKLAADLADKGYIAGTLYTETKLRDFNRAQTIKKKMLATAELKPPNAWVASIT